jgi:Bacterial SH3 domain
MIKMALFFLPPLVLLAVAGLILSLRAAPTVPAAVIPTWLPANSQTNVEVTPGSAPLLYSLNLTGATRVKLDTSTPDFAFAAEIHDSAGQTVAAFHERLQNIQFTLASGLYQLAVTSVDPKHSGTVSLALGDAVIAPEAIDGAAQHVLDCRVANTSPAGVIVRSAPAAQYAVLGTLNQKGELPALGRTDNGWFSIAFGERQGWIKSDVVTPSGNCGALPLVRNPAIPVAPIDVPAYLLQVDRDGSGSFTQAISTPDGDHDDLIWVRVINLYTEPPNNYRQFVLTLDCRGERTDDVRWGNPYAPTHRCGESITVPFLSGSEQQPVSVLFAPGSPQNYVEYRLRVELPKE